MYKCTEQNKELEIGEHNQFLWKLERVTQYKHSQLRKQELNTATKNSETIQSNKLLNKYLIWHLKQYDKL